MPWNTERRWVPGGSENLVEVDEDEEETDEEREAREAEEAAARAAAEAAAQAERDAAARAAAGGGDNGGQPPPPQGTISSGTLTGDVGTNPFGITFGGSGQIPVNNDPNIIGSPASSIGSGQSQQPPGTILDPYGSGQYITPIGSGGGGGGGGISIGGIGIPDPFGGGGGGGSGSGINILPLPVNPATALVLTGAGMLLGGGSGGSGPFVGPVQYPTPNTPGQGGGVQPDPNAGGGTIVPPVFPPEQPPQNPVVPTPDIDGGTANPNPVYVPTPPPPNAQDPVEYKPHTPVVIPGGSPDKPKDISIDGGVANPNPPYVAPIPDSRAQPPNAMSPASNPTGSSITHFLFPFLSEIRTSARSGDIGMNEPCPYSIS